MVRFAQPSMVGASDEARLGAMLLKVQEVCPLPACAHRVLALCADPDSRVDEIAALVATDAALAAEVLRVANSAAYGAPGRISHLQAAVGRIGLSRLQTLTAALAMLAAFSTETELSEELHDRAALSGSIARILGKGVPTLDAETAFICGLLADIGALACFTIDPEGYGEIRSLAKDDFSLCEQLEIERYGVTCRAVAGGLLRRNGLPEDVARAVEAGPESTPLVFLDCVTMFARWAAAPLIRAGRAGNSTKLGNELRELALRARFDATSETLIDLCLQACERAMEGLDKAR